MLRLPSHLHILGGFMKAKEVQELLLSIAPEGLTVKPELKKETFGQDEYESVILENQDGSVWLEVKPFSDKCIDGSTCFRTKNGVRTFDRRGVDSSFYLTDWDGKVYSNEKIKETLEEQLSRALKAIAKQSQSAVVPGLPGDFTLTPDELVNKRKELEKLGYTKFTPAGFGTGYIVQKKKTRWSSPAKKELIEFFGMGSLYIETWDHD